MPMRANNKIAKSRKFHAFSQISVSIGYENSLLNIPRGNELGSLLPSIASTHLLLQLVMKQLQL
jgi:hypothetical protein